MNSKPVFIVIDIKNQINSIHNSSTLFTKKILIKTKKDYFKVEKIIEQSYQICDI